MIGEPHSGLDDIALTRHAGSKCRNNLPAEKRQVEGYSTTE